MRLQAAPAVDLRQRLLDELKGFPRAISLDGNPMQVEIAKRLLTEHGIDTAGGELVRLASLEQHGSAFLESFLEEKDPPEGRFLFRTIPESELIAFAQRNGIPVIEEERSDVRRMLDAIAERQPQTYFSLSRSSQRLNAAAELLRKCLDK